MLLVLLLILVIHISYLYDFYYFLIASRLCPAQPQGVCLAGELSLAHSPNACLLLLIATTILTIVAVVMVTVYED